jgi:hypothetical protein
MIWYHMLRYTYDIIGIMITMISLKQYDIMVHIMPMIS